MIVLNVLGLVALALFGYGAYTAWRDHIRPLRCPRCSESNAFKIRYCTRADCRMIDRHDGPSTLQ